MTIACIRALLSIHSNKYLEDSDPGESNIVERDGTAVRITKSGLADGVELVPVDAGRGRCWTSCHGGRVRSPVTRYAVLGPQWNVVGAMRHTVVSWLTADEVDAVWTYVRIG